MRVNSTWGLGLLDIASEAGLPKMGISGRRWALGRGRGRPSCCPSSGPRTVRGYAVALPADMMGNEPFSIDHVPTRNSRCWARASCMAVRCCWAPTARWTRPRSTATPSCATSIEQRRYKVSDGQPGTRCSGISMNRSAAPLGRGWPPLPRSRSPRARRDRRDHFDRAPASPAKPSSKQIQHEQDPRRDFSASSSLCMMFGCRAARQLPAAVKAPDVLVRDVTSEVLEIARADKAIRPATPAARDRLVDSQGAAALRFSPHDHARGGPDWRQATPGSRTGSPTPSVPCSCAPTQRAAPGTATSASSSALALRARRGRAWIRTEVVQTGAQPVGIDYMPRKRAIRAGRCSTSSSPASAWSPTIAAASARRSARGGIDGLISRWKAQPQPRQQQGCSRGGCGRGIGSLAVTRRPLTMASAPALRAEVAGWRLLAPAVCGRFRTRCTVDSAALALLLDWALCAAGRHRLLCATCRPGMLRPGGSTTSTRCRWSPPAKMGLPAIPSRREQGLRQPEGAR